MEEAQDHKFWQLFIAYDALENSFSFCQPTLGLDGTHFNTKYLGILLIAVDTNN